MGAVEIVNSIMAPPTTCHSFTFTAPRHDNLAFGKNPAEPMAPGVSRATYDSTSTEQSVAIEHIRSPAVAARRSPIMASLSPYGLMPTELAQPKSRLSRHACRKVRWDSSFFDPIRSSRQISPVWEASRENRYLGGCRRSRARLECRKQVTVTLIWTGDKEERSQGRPFWIKDWRMIPW